MHGDLHKNCMTSLDMSHYIYTDITIAFSLVHM